MIFWFSEYVKFKTRRVLYTYWQISGAWAKPIYEKTSIKIYFFFQNRSQIVFFLGNSSNQFWNFGKCQRSWMSSQDKPIRVHVLGKSSWKKTRSWEDGSWKGSPKLESTTEIGFLLHFNFPTSARFFQMQRNFRTSLSNYMYPVKFYLMMIPWSWNTVNV